MFIMRVSTAEKVFWGQRSRSWLL